MKQRSFRQEAVLKTIDECVKRDILSEFLMTRKVEVVDIMMALYDKEINMQMFGNSERAIGHTEGRAEGYAEGYAEVRAEMVDTIMKNTGKDLAYACSISGVSEQEYHEAKKIQEKMTT